MELQRELRSTKVQDSLLTPDRFELAPLNLSHAGLQVQYRSASKKSLAYSVAIIL